MVVKIRVKIGMASDHPSFLVGTALTACPADWHFIPVNIRSRVIITLSPLLLETHVDSA